jgi:hypothetical protein
VRHTCSAAQVQSHTHTNSQTDQDGKPRPDQPGEDEEGAGNPALAPRFRAQCHLLMALCVTLPPRAAEAQLSSAPAGTLHRGPFVSYVLPVLVIAPCSLALVTCHRVLCPPRSCHCSLFPGSGHLSDLLLSFAIFHFFSRLSWGLCC